MKQEALIKKIQERFIQKKWTLTLAESCTGGAIAASLTKLSGSSQYFLGSLVTYSNAFKIDWLDIEASLIQTYGAVSEEVVKAMVKGLLKRTKSDFGIAVSGIAGPLGGTSEKPVGTVWIAVANGDFSTQTLLLSAIGNREAIIEEATVSALKLLIEFTN